MKTVNSLSSGKSSSLIAMEYKADYDVFSVVCSDSKKIKVKDPAVLKYAQDKLSGFVEEFGEFIATVEDDLSLKVMMDLEQLIGREITWVRGKSFEQVISNPSKTRLPGKLFRYCTEQMKLLPIFLWWWRELNAERCRMRIGFRSEEFKRMLRFFNNSDPSYFKHPTSTSTRGKRIQKHTTFKWRFCEMPLIEDRKDRTYVNNFWDQEFEFGIGGILSDKRKVIFPIESNCVGCFWKDTATIATQSVANPEKIQWFSDQEKIGRGTWRSDGITYQELIDNPEKYGLDKLFEYEQGIYSCDSGGCTA